MLIEEIKKYESDTFSAEGSKIADYEAVQIAQQLIKSWTDTHLDGIIITEMLGEIRKGHNKCQQQ